MRQIVASMPNFSEGRRSDVIDAIVGAIGEAGSRVIDVHADPDHNRSVVTFIGTPAEVEHSAVAAAATAARLIDMDAHRGVHPRIGATDVIPFVPVVGVTMAECVALSRRVGKRLADELDLPVYLYGESAERPERSILPAVRRGEYEGLKDVIGSDPARAPDYGPKSMGPAGATAVGARHPLVAANAYLDGSDLEAAEAVARAVRESSGGLTHVQARAFRLASADAIQVSLNLLRPDITPLYRVFELLRLEAARRGARVTHTEIVGLVPQAVLADAAGWYLHLDDLGPELILENHLAPGAVEATPKGPSPRQYVEAVASDSPTPGGGSVASLVGALAAALTSMVAGLTVGKAAYAAVEDDMKRLRARAFELQRELLELMSADETAFEGVMSAYKLPKDTSEAADARRDAVQTALRQATVVPLETMRRGVEILRLAHTAAEHGNVNTISDAGIAGHLARSAVHSASLNVAINVRHLRDLGEGDRFRREAADLVKAADHLVDDVDRTVRGRIAG